MNSAQSLQLLKHSLNQHGLHDWTGKLDNARRRFGLCDFKNRCISISRPLCELNSDDEVRDTILHEIAHALAWVRHGVNCGHDKRWKSICTEIGARPEACYDNEVTQPSAPWVLAHRDTGEVFRSYFKVPKRNWSGVWIRGRKAETLGKLVIKATTANDAPANTPSDENPTARLNAQQVEQMRARLVEFATELSKEYGLTDVNSTGRYHDLGCKITLTMSRPKDKNDNSEQQEFAVLAPVFDLTPDDYLREFSANGEFFRLTGFKMQNRKYPIIAVDKTGRKYKFERWVLDQLINS